MNQRFDQALQQDLAAIEAQGLLRRLRRVDSPQGRRIVVQGRDLLNFSSNDYLGFANHPAVRDAATEATARFGAGAGASRLISGSLAPHAELEEALADFKGTEAALSFSTGYSTAFGTIAALVGKGDVVVIDRLVHASIIDAVRLSGASLRVFRHNDPDNLESILRTVVTRQAGRDSEGTHRHPRLLVVTESVFSMDGDQAPLQSIVEIKERHGAWLMVDEAHATGILGQRGRGLAAACGLADRIEVQMGTLGKALGASGGFICGSRWLIDLLINRARSFVFSTAPVPSAVAAASTAIRLVQNEVGEALRRHLWVRVAQCLQAVYGVSVKPASAIVPIRIGDEREAVKIGSRLWDEGVFVPAVRYPTVPRGEARLRLSLTATHTSADVEHAVKALSEARVAGTPGQPSAIGSTQ